MKDSYEELKRVFHKYHTKILLGDFSASVGREDILKPVGSEGLQEISNDGVRVVNFATSKNLTVESTMFSHCDIHKLDFPMKRQSARALLIISLLP
jgi:hypothetical protein